MSKRKTKKVEAPAPINEKDGISENDVPKLPFEERGQPADGERPASIEERLFNLHESEILGEREERAAETHALAERGKALPRDEDGNINAAALNEDDMPEVADEDEDWEDLDQTDDSEPASETEEADEPETEDADESSEFDLAELEGAPPELRDAWNELMEEWGDRPVPVREDGEWKAAPLSELQRGYIAQRTTTQRFQEAAEKRKEADATLEAAAQAATAYADRLEVVGDNMTPEQQQELRQARAFRQQAVGRLFNQSQAATRQAMESGAVDPAWSDPERLQADMREMEETALSYGFSPQQVGSIHSLPEIQLLRDAMLYRRAKANTESAKAGGAKSPSKNRPLQPGGRKVPGGEDGRAKLNRKKVGQLREKLRHSGRPEDAAALLSQVMPEDF